MSFARKMREELCAKRFAGKMREELKNGKMRDFSVSVSVFGQFWAFSALKLNFRA
ncbi:MAG: hypothetical protein MJ086_04310 [Lachnospiraceae bacterium]|nr:hypothetical protein [Lachnospiraceae bacterium]